MSTLILMRHGAAEWISPDEARPLSLTGVEQTQQQIAKRAAELATVTELLVSPYLRAQQTAALLTCAESVTCNQADWLTPDTAPNRVVAELAKLPDSRVRLLVAHNPLLTRLLNTLLGEVPGRYHLGTSAMAALQLPVIAPSCAELLWLDAGF